jgi:hypothetical protein
MNAFEDVVKLFLEENNYWVRQSFKVTTITKEDKRNIGKHSLPTPEIDMIALNLDRNELLLVEAKSFLDSHGIYCSLLNTPTIRSRDGVLPASHLLFSKMQGNEVESVNTPTVRSWEVYFRSASKR